MGYSHIFLCFITTSYQSDAGQYNNILGSNSNMLHQKNKFIPSQLTHYQVPLDPQTSSPETTFTNNHTTYAIKEEHHTTTIYT